MESSTGRKRRGTTEAAAVSNSSDQDWNNSDTSSASEQSQPPSDIKKRKTYRPHVKAHSLNGYNKKKLLDYLKKNGCNAANFENAMRSYKVSRESALGFLNEHLQQAQKYLHQECDSLSFKNNNAWLELFSNTNLYKHCMYEPALVTSAIANNESHPAAQELNGVDLKSIYKFLSNALLGLPQPELSAASAKFLASEFESLIEEANTDEGDMDTLQMNNQLKSCELLDVVKHRNKISLDPLLLNEDLPSNQRQIY